MHLQMRLVMFTVSPPTAPAQPRHSPRSAPDSPIQHRVGVPAAVGTGTVNLKRQSIIKIPGYRAACHCNADQGAVVFQPDAELMASRWLIVPMESPNELAGTPECNGYDNHGSPQTLCADVILLLAYRPVVGLPAVFI